jgi:hypothetical protein
MDEDQLNNCREKFEEIETKRLGGLMLNRRNNADYFYPHIQDRWILWQQAWEALLEENLTTKYREAKVDLYWPFDFKESTTDAEKVTYYEKLLQRNSKVVCEALDLCHEIAIRK